ncbi:hypothetical protein HYN59_07265 [Flavobacterium album]|uniref:Uncharacterized protein n=1 Tax=Flavobacterium album TaxID=2175091 RepID=A0A2S1QX08_9FLAO|nr:hypothetical protein [Flavobacterium album]AWH84938.1 hypothetical protein HYN59_07265 [Flavobacterium album]
MENQKLTQRPQAATITENALIHIAEPFDISQGPDGSSYKFPAANLFAAGQDNIDIRKYISVEDADNLSTILSKINSLPQYVVNEKQSVWFVTKAANRSADGLYSAQRILKFKMMNKGKGTYGSGATQLTSNDIELIYSNDEVLSDIGADPVTDIVDYGALENETQTVSQWLNSRNPEIVIQPQNEGYTLFQGKVDGIPVSYLWIGLPGVYGAGEQQSIDADFQTLDDTIPQYDNNTPLIRNIGLIQVFPVIQGMCAKLNQLTTIITPLDTPVLFTGYTIGETGAGISHTFLFMGGKGTWGVGGNNIAAHMLYLLLEKPLGTDDIEDNDTTIIIPLGEIEEGGFLAAANFDEHDFTGTGLEYYFSYYIGDVLYLALFIGAPGVYGSDIDSDYFTNADFAQVTNDNISGMPTLQLVNAEGNGTTDPLTVKDTSGTPKLSHRSDRLIFTDVENIEHEYSFSQEDGNRIARINEAIPITGTTGNNPVTGDIEFEGSRQFINGDINGLYSIIYLNDNSVGMNSISTEPTKYSGFYISSNYITSTIHSPNANSSFTIGATGISMNIGNTFEEITSNVSFSTSGLTLNSNDPASKGISGSADYTPNIGDLDYTQKKYVDARTLQQILSNGTVATIGTNLALNTAMGNFQINTNGDVFFGGAGTFQISHPNIQITGNTAFAGDVQITGSPYNSTSAVHRGYVDNAIAGLNFKAQCVVATTGNSALSGLLTIDGITLTGGERVLVKNQITASENGIYIANSSSWTRASDADTGSELENKTIPVTKGVVNQDTWWTITNDSISLGTTSITFSQTGGMGTYANGTGLQLVGNIFSADPNYIATAVATALTGKEPVINAGLSGQYWRGDKTWQTLNKSAVGLGNVDDTSDTNKPVSTAQQMAMNGLLNKLKNDVADSSALTGSTTETIMGSCYIAAGTIAAGTLTLKMPFAKSFANGTVVLKVYCNATNDLMGSPVSLGAYTAAANVNYIPFFREFLLKTGNVIFGCNAATSSVDGRAVSTSAPLSATFNTSNNNYIIVTATLANGSDSVTLKGFEVLFDKAV